MRDLIFHGNLLFSTALWSNYDEGLFVSGMEPGLEGVPVPLQVWSDDHWGRRPGTTTREVSKGQTVWQLETGMQGGLLGMVATCTWKICACHLLAGVQYLYTLLYLELVGGQSASAVVIVCVQQSA